MINVESLYESSFSVSSSAIASSNAFKWGEKGITISEQDPMELEGAKSSN